MLCEIEKVWKKLGYLSVTDAMSGFVSLLDSVCPPFRDFINDYVQSQKKNSERVIDIESEKNKGLFILTNLKQVFSNVAGFVSPVIFVQIYRQIECADKHFDAQQQSRGPSVYDIERYDAQRRQIQEALNQQTHHQFRAYAQQQFVGDLVQVNFV
ncbi:unnamed protein product [Dracunculus medinensis]|uniref:Tho2 domain-containing protein n=1 Tax=Dracunculus medinensis TaxID=318479 RepID=A0A158Q5A4_DRAME|nr:unnamed protein product [Dracunculus medinensis]